MPALRHLKIDDSHIIQIGYSHHDGKLDIVFRTNQMFIYRYSNVPWGLFDGLINAPSCGSFFDREIKKHPDLYPFEKLHTGDVLMEQERQHRALGG